MTMLFCDSFDHYATADFAKKWTATTGSPTINTSAGRRSGGCLRTTTFSAYVAKSITATASFVFGVAVNPTTFSVFVSGGQAIIALWDSGTAQCDLRFNVDGTLSVTRNGTALTGGTSTLVLPLNGFHYIEWKVTIADSIGANSCKVRVDGVDWINVTAGQDTKNTANPSANQIRIGQTLSPPGSTTVDFDDLYICDQAGSTNNDFLGDCRVDALLPNGEGSHLDFTPSTGGTHYLLVDESTPNTTDYNDSSTAGHKDSYAMQDLSAIATSTIFAVQALGAVLKDDAGARSIKVGVRTNTGGSPGSIAQSAAQALSTSQLYYANVSETDPSTGVAWTESGVNGAEALFENV